MQMITVLPTNLQRRRSPQAVRWRTAATLACMAMLVACANPPPPPPVERAIPLPQRPVPPSAAQSFDAAIDYAVDDLLVQIQRLPGIATAAKPAQGKALKKILVDVSLDSVSGQQVAATRFLDERLLARATARFPQFDVAQLSTERVEDKAALAGQFLLAATLSPVSQQANDALAKYRINLSLTDLGTGFVVAQASALTTALGVDSTPTQFYRESPSISRDRLVDGQIRTAKAEAGTEADGVYVANVAVSALIVEGSQLYDAGKYAEALRIYEKASARIEGGNLRVLNGLYLSNVQLGRTEAAEAAFARLVALGLGTNSLSVKFLFSAGSVEFLPDPKISSPYPMWLRVIGKEITVAKHCVDIVGHSSRTGAEQVNNRLSLARAVAIQRRLEALAPELRKALKTSGMGYRENIIGTGTDDLRDALDRRVEFKTRACS